MSATMKDVANRAGVSQSTVSRVLSGTVPVNQETKARVYKAIRELDYKINAVAQGLKNGRTNLFGVVLPDVRNPFFPPVLRGVDDAAMSLGFTVLHTSSDDKPDVERERIECLLSQGVAGLLVVPANPPSEVREMADRVGIPVVLISRGNTGECHCVAVDHRKGGALAAHHLLSLNHREIVLVNGPEKIDLFRLRRQGFESAIEDHPWVRMRSIDAENTVEGGYRAVKGLLEESEHSMSALFCGTDYLAVGAIRALSEAGLSVPEDVSVVGFDGLSIGEFVQPPLTTIEQPMYDIGYLACKRLHQLLSSDAMMNPTLLLEPKLVVRKSTAPWPGGQSATVTGTT